MFVKKIIVSIISKIRTVFFFFVPTRVSDKTVYGKGLNVFNYPEFEIITKIPNLVGSYYECFEAVICPKTGLAFSRNGFYILDKAPYSYHSSKFKTNNLNFKERIAKAISFLGPFMDNYFHFLSHIIFAAPLINLKYIDYILLIPAQIEKKKQYVDALNFFFPKNKIIFCKDSLLINHLIKLDIIITKESIRLFHEFTQKLNLPLKKLYFERIFVMRNNAKRRILKNQSEINMIVNSFGYKSVDCSELSFIDQISYFINAKYIIGVHGAALGNILFSENLKNVIEILSPEDYSLIYEAIAGLKNANYFPITGTVVNKKEFSVNVQKVKKNITRAFLILPKNLINLYKLG
jgi:hypothetical protein